MLFDGADSGRARELFLLAHSKGELIDRKMPCRDSGSSRVGGLCKSLHARPAILWTMTYGQAPTSLGTSERTQSISDRKTTFRPKLSMRALWKDLQTGTRHPRSFEEMRDPKDS